MNPSSWSGLLVDHPAMHGYRRLGRARKRALRATRLQADPPLTVLGHDRAVLDDDGKPTGEREPIAQPFARTQRASFRQARRDRRRP